MCGCNKNRVPSKQKSASLPRPGLAITPNLAAAAPKVQSNNVNPMMAMSLPTPTGLADADKRRIQKLRQEAMQKSLGKLA